MPIKKLTHEEKEEIISKAKTHTLKTLKRECKLSRNNLLGYLNKALSNGSLNPEEYSSFIERSIVERKLKVSRPFPTEIERRLEAMLSSVNTEIKQITLTLLNEKPKITSHIKALYDFVTNNVWDIGGGNFEEYCRSTFIPIGMIAEESLIFSDSGKLFPAWKTSEAGEKYGKPIARFCLRKANEYQVSFHTIFGKTASPLGDFRAPLTTALILEYLSNEKEVRKEDILKRFGISKSSASAHLRKLKENGFVNGESVTNEKHWQKYCWIKERKLNQIKPLGTQKTLTKDVATIAYKLRDRITIPAVVDKLKEKRGKEIKIKDKSLTDIIPLVLSDLAKQGFLSRGKFSSSKHSWWEITYKGKEFTEDVVKRIRNALEDGNELDYMQGIKDLFTPEYMKDSREGVLLYKAVSPYTKVMPRYKKNEKVYEIIKNNQGIRAKEIKRIMGGKVTHNLKDLIMGNLVYKKKNGIGVNYYPK